MTITEMYNLPLNQFEVEVKKYIFKKYNIVCSRFLPRVKRFIRFKYNSVRRGIYPRTIKKLIRSVLRMEIGFEIS